MTAADWRRLVVRTAAVLLALGVVADLGGRLFVERQEAGPDVLFGLPLLPYPKPPIRMDGAGEDWLRPDGQRGWTPRPLASSSDGLHHTDSLGLRAPEPAERPSDASAKRILLLGSEPAHSTGLPFEQSLGALLERSCPGTEVLNAGVPGYGPGQAFLHLLRVLDGLGDTRSPDLVLVFLHPGDLEQALRVLPPGGPPGPHAWSAELGFSKPRFRPSGAQDLSLVNVPPPAGADLAAALADYDASRLASLDGLHVPGAFEPHWSDVSLLARCRRSARARAAAGALVDRLHGRADVPGGPDAVRDVTLRILGQMRSALAGCGATLLVVTSPDLDSLAAARAGEARWSTAFPDEVGAASCVDLVEPLAQGAATSHLPDSSVVHPRRRGALTGWGAELAAAHLAPVVSAALAAVPRDR